MEFDRNQPEGTAMTVAQLLVSMHAVSIPHKRLIELYESHLLSRIKAVIRNTPEYLASDPNYRMEIVFPRHAARFPWRGKKIQMWRLDLEDSIWLGIDGILYRAYDIDTLDGVEYPQYLLRAEIERYSFTDLEPILKAVTVLVKPPHTAA